MDSFDLKTHDDTALRCRSWAPDAQPPVAVLVIVHGLGEHSGRYQPLAEHLTGHGFHVYAYDTRGHGLTAGDRERLGQFAAGNGWLDWIHDINHMITHARALHPKTPVFLLGHSLGSIMAQHYAAIHGDRLHGLILSATDSRPGLITRAGVHISGLLQRLQGPDHRSELLYSMGVGAMKRSMPDRRTDQDWLSRDDNIVDAYLADPLCGFKPGNAMWRAIAEGMQTISYRLRGRAPAELPILMLVGTADLLSAGGKRVRKLALAYQKNGVRQVELISYPEARHEVFNETNRDEVYRDLVRWVQARLRGEVSGDVDTDTREPLPATS
ncbi:MAG: lysophospholipase [Ectothiorhodospiraceae bacterium]|nr:lysophospholipase [Ectothiorhodospiraceae bacterium]MCH8504782.1 alpha/beta hydrolase [Ectothiorhodospiraceae bacterium]